MHLAATDSSRGSFSYMMLSKLLVSALAILLLSSCAAFKGFPERATSPSEDLEVLRDDIGAAAITECLELATTACRNKIIAARMYAIDIQFSEFEEDLFRQTRETGFAATVATLGLTAAAAASTSPASQILAGVAAFIIGTREAFQKEVLAERTLVAIHTAMRAQRARAALRLRAGLQQSVDAYPLALGLNDLDAYYNAGTVLGALVGITETVGAEAQRAERQLQEQLTFKLDEPAEKIRAFVCGDDPNCSNPDATKFPQIQRCWPGAGVPADTFMLDFVLQDAFAEQRRAVESCLRL